ncbi:hypothetical protein J2Z84_000293 [Agrobacterium rubi]|nr:hypothetical protein [Agrobacterium rubi]
MRAEYAAHPPISHPKKSQIFFSMATNPMPTISTLSRLECFRETLSGQAEVGDWP